MRVCSGAGCLRTVPDDVRFCDDCKPVMSESPGREHVPPGKAAPSHRDGIRLSGNQRAQNDPFQKEYMSPRWRDFTRVKALTRSPLCPCGASAQIVDHKIPARLVHAACAKAGLFPFQKIKGFHCQENLEPLCHSCHNAKTASEATTDWTEPLAALMLQLERYRSKD